MKHGTEVLELPVFREVKHGDSGMRKGEALNIFLFGFSGLTC